MCPIKPINFFEEEEVMGFLEVQEGNLNIIEDLQVPPFDDSEFEEMFGVGDIEQLVRELEDREMEIDNEIVEEVINMNSVRREEEEEDEIQIIENQPEEVIIISDDDSDNNSLYDEETVVLSDYSEEEEEQEEEEEEEEDPVYLLQRRIRERELFWRRAQVNLRRNRDAELMQLRSDLRRRRIAEQQQRGRRRRRRGLNDDRPVRFRDICWGCGRRFWLERTWLWRRCGRCNLWLCPQCQTDDDHRC